MNVMPLPFEEFQGKQQVLGFSSDLWKQNCYVGSSSTEPTSVLDTRRSPSSPTSSSTLSSSHASGVVAPPVETNKASEELKCGAPLGMEYWENVLSGSLGQDRSVSTLVMSDIDQDPSLGFNKLLQSSHHDLGFNLSFDDQGYGAFEEQHSAGISNIVDPFDGGNAGAFSASLPHVLFQQQQHSVDPVDDKAQIFNDCVVMNQNQARFPESPAMYMPPMTYSQLQDGHFVSPPHAKRQHSRGYGAFEEQHSAGISNIVDPFDGGNAGAFSASLPHVLFQQQQHSVDPVDDKAQIFNDCVVMNQNQARFPESPAMYMPPMTYSQLQDGHFVSPPHAKRQHSRGFGRNYPGQDLFSQAQAQQQYHHMNQQQLLPMVPQHLQHRPVILAAKDKMVNNLEGDKELMNSLQLHQTIIDQLVNAAELVESGNPLLVQGILARLNQQLSPIGKPFQRAAFYFKEALELLLNNSRSSANFSPFDIIYKIVAYKAFSEISPVLQFANFTCNQAILECVEGYNCVHVIDFDIGYGGQWASFMQEVALRNGGSPPSLKITAFVCCSMHNDFELAFTQDNLKNFATELNLAFELEIISIEALNTGSFPSQLHGSDGVVVAVNFPIGSLLNSPVSLPLVLRYVKQLSPKIVVTLERGSDRTDIPFPHQIIHAVHSYSSLLESLDAVNANPDTLQKIERYILQPNIEKNVRGRYLAPKRTPATSWRTLFSSSGFFPLAFSNFTESQAECLVRRIPVGGFHVEKRQSSLVLCWKRKDLVSASAWRC